MIEQLLLTRPGERVNRPEFGAGLMHAVFGASGPEAATALELASRAALHRYLGDIIEVQSLTARAEDAALIVDVRYVVRRTAEQRTATVSLGQSA
ncbi:MAG TPA: GPW/gp25 family protein [Sphingomicrobium sp.]